MSKSAEKEKNIKPNQQNTEDTKSEKEEAEQSVKEQSELEKLSEELEETKDLLMRTAAEYDNYKKRTQREAEKIGAVSRADVIKQLLPIVDNLERALQNADADITDYKKGIDMTTKQFFDILAKLGLKEIEAQGKPFDANMHYAVTQVEDQNAEPDSVVQVLQKGYKMGETVLRPAMVAVAKAD